MDEGSFYLCIYLFTVSFFYFPTIMKILIGLYDDFRQIPGFIAAIYNRTFEYKVSSIEDN
jgi:hypothetical protein